MQYGYTGNISTSWKSQNEGGDKLAYAAATQLLIWETVVGERDSDFNHVDTGSYDAVADQISNAHPLRAKIISYYSSIESSVQEHSKLPSFMSKTAGRAQSIELAWNGSEYDDSRYHALNLHSVFSKGTIEFRMFNSTLHAGEVKSYIQLCLAISHQALVQRGASRIKTQPENEKYTFRTWLLRLGLIGDEFKTARQHLLKNLEGNIAWRDPAQAEAQKARLAAKRLAEQQVQEQPEEIQQAEADEPTEQEQDAPALSMQM